MKAFDVAGYHVRGVMHGVRALGLDADVLLREAAIDPRALDDPEARFAEPLLFRLWLTAERLYGKPAFGVALATHVPFGKLELIDYLVAACSTVGSGFECLEHHARLCASGFYYDRIAAEHDGQPGTLVKLEHRHGIQNLPRSLVEYLCTLVVTRVRSVCGPAFDPVVHLQRAPEGPARLYLEALGRAPRLSDADALFVSEPQWNLDNPRRDPTLAALLRAHARDVGARMPEDGFDELARHAIVEALHMGDPAIARVAARLGLSPRTLQRRLEASGSSYQVMVDAVRRELALRYLSNTKLSLNEISGLLAYAEPSAFGRAFRRWTGSSPASFRERQLERGAH